MKFSMTGQEKVTF